MPNDGAATTGWSGWHEVRAALGHLRSVGDGYPAELAIADAIDHLQRALAANRKETHEDE